MNRIHFICRINYFFNQVNTKYKKIRVSVSVKVSVKNVSVSGKIKSIGHRYRSQLNMSIGIGIGIGLKLGIGASLICRNIGVESQFFHRVFMHFIDDDNFRVKLSN